MGASEAPGWDAIDAAARRVYGDVTPSHWGTLIKWALGGPDPLDGVSAYDAGDSFHYISYGLSELYAKQSDDPKRSGHGFELTLRLAKRAGEREAPIWPVTLLQSLARYVCNTGNIFAPGDHVDLRGKLGGLEETELTALVFALDGDLGAIDTPHGHLHFVQAFAVTADELDAVRSWHCDRFLDLVRERTPKLVVDPTRASYRKDPAFEAKVQAGIDRDGSSQGATFTEQLSWEKKRTGQVAVTIGAIAVSEIERMARTRIPFGRPFRLLGPDASVVFWPEDKADLRDGEPEDDATLFVDLTPEMAGALLRGLSRARGTYTFPELPGFTLVVEPTEIRDANGQVVEVLG
jgi:hypothetical protein